MNNTYDEKLIKNRKKNAVAMTLTGFLFVAISIICPFAIRTLMIYEMGDNYAGINTVLYSIISILNMTELGLGSVIVYFLYDPVARGDIKDICKYLNVLKKIYRFIALAVLIIGIAVIPFLKIVIKDDIPSDANLYSSYLFFLLSTIILYLGFPEAEMLFNAFQKGAIINSIKIVASIICYALQVTAIIVIKSFLFYFIAIFVQSLVMIALRCYFQKKYYPDIKAYGDVDSGEKSEIKKRVLSILGHQMDEKFLSSVDNVILSYFCGLSVVTVYGNYMYVVSALGMFFIVMFNALTVTIGNAIVTESKESNYDRYKKIMFINVSLVSWIFITMSVVYNEFMTVWMGKRLLPLETVILFCLYFFVIQIRKTVVTFKNANGMWWDDRYKPYVSMVINLALDIYLVRIIGINGALISSILCILLIEIPWETKVLFDRYFNKSMRLHFIKLFEGLVICVFGSWIAFSCCSFIRVEGMFLNFILHGFLCSILFGIPFCLICWKKGMLNWLKR